MTLNHHNDTIMADDLKSSFKKERRCNMTDSKELRSLIEEKGFKLKSTIKYTTGVKAGCMDGVYAAKV